MDELKVDELKVWVHDQWAKAKVAWSVVVVVIAFVVNGYFPATPVCDCVDCQCEVCDCEDEDGHDHD